MKNIFISFLIMMSANTIAQIPVDSLSLWLRADMGVVTSGTDIIQWNDQSGNNRHAITTTATNPQLVPDEICGNPAVRFNSGQGFTTPTFQTFENKRGTFFVVVKCNGGTGTGNYGTFISTYASGTGILWQLGSNLSQYQWFDGVGTNSAPIVSSPPNQWGIITLNRNADASLDFYKSGTFVINHNITNNQPNSNPMLIGYNSFSEFLNGDIAEIILYNKSLSSSEIFLVNTYLANKYCFNSSVVSPTAINQDYCGPTSFNLTASGGTHYNWYDSPNSTTILDTNAVFTTPLLTSTDTFYVANYNDTLESVRTMVIATVYPLPVVTLALAVDSLCSSNPPLMLVGGSPVGGTYSGTGVSGGYFNPTTLSVGYYDIVYEFIDSNNCTSSDTSQIYVDMCAGLDNMETAEQFVTISPNPSTGIFQLTLSELPSTRSSLEIYNALGKNIYSILNLEKQHEINLSELAKGIYFVKILDGGKAYTQKIVIQ